MTTELNKIYQNKIARHNNHSFIQNEYVLKHASFTQAMCVFEV